MGALTGGVHAGAHAGIALDLPVDAGLGVANSSNSNRLRELAEKLGCRAYLINDAREIDTDSLRHTAYVGLTAGASAPESRVQEVIQRLKQEGGRTHEAGPSVEEKVVFQIPRTMRAEAG